MLAPCDRKSPLQICCSRIETVSCPHGEQGHRQPLSMDARRPTFILHQLPLPSVPVIGVENESTGNP
jgi:hypothetical protein